MTEQEPAQGPRPAHEAQQQAKQQARQMAEPDARQVAEPDARQAAERVSVPATDQVAERVAEPLARQVAEELADPAAEEVAEQAGGQMAASLLAEARAALHHAYSPYSRFAVGAAVADERGRIFRGTNVENASYGLTMCAERVAVFSAITAGAKKIKAIAVIGAKVDALSPCGACRQVLSEFCEPDTAVFLGIGERCHAQTTVGQLLPFAFAGDALDRNE